MAKSSRKSHPDHGAEQAYLERVHRAELASRGKASRAAESAPDKASARAQLEMARARLKQPLDPEALCFGKMDLQDGKQFYLGRGKVSDEENNLLVINWRVPFAKPFYEASRADACGLTRRRRFELEDIRLLSIVDETFIDAPEPKAPKPPATRPATRKRREPSEPAQRGDDVNPPPGLSTPPPAQPAEPVHEPSLTPVAEHPTAPKHEAPEPTLTDAILADMDRARGAEMRDIVATIEARQYELISDGIDGVLVVQGGPGSGKTAIALHRAAWLLFNHHEELQRAGALIVGPNRAFMEYIAKVLPSLGETAVTQSAVDRLIELPDVRVRGEDAPELARLKGDPRMAPMMRRALNGRLRVPNTDTEVIVDRARVRITAQEMRDLIASAQAGDRSFLVGRMQFQQSLYGLVSERISDRKGRFRSGPDASAIQSAVTGQGGVADRVWPSVSPVEVVRDLFNSNQRIKYATPELSADEQALLHRPKARSVGDEPWTSADIALLDEAHYLLGNRTSSFGYVLVDEAQDLSPMQLRMVFRRALENRATLVGDMAQSTAAWRFTDWEGLLDSVQLQNGGRIAELVIGYRVPSQIMDLASALLPRIAPDIVPTQAVREGDEDPRVLQIRSDEAVPEVVAEVLLRRDGERSVGVIVPDDMVEPIRTSLEEASIEVGRILTDGLDRTVTLLSADQAKGLEFDHVIVLEPSRIAGEQDDWAKVYVALTRATRTLSVLYTTAEPFEHGAPEAEPVQAAPEQLSQELPPPAERLGARYSEALMRAKFIHDGQTRRGTGTPYLAHLQAVASLVLEDGGSEDEAIAALLHDSIEDHGGALMVEQIETQFGTRVAAIVLGCTDPSPEGDVAWRDMKRQHLRELEAGGPLVRRVSLAEKLDNARALLRDYRRLGDALWERMDVDPDDLLWYISELADLFTTERPGDMAYELKDTVERVIELASRPADQVEDGTKVPAATSR